MTQNGPLHTPAMKVHAHVKKCFRSRLQDALDAYDKGDPEALKEALDSVHEFRHEYLIELMTNVELIEKEARLTNQLRKAKIEGYDEFFQSWNPFLNAIKAELKSRGFN